MHLHDYKYLFLQTNVYKQIGSNGLMPDWANQGKQKISQINSCDLIFSCLNLQSAQSPILIHIGQALT